MGGLIPPEQIKEKRGAPRGVSRVGNGDGGGYVVCIGTPEDVAHCDASYTGQYLKRMLE